MICPEQSRSSYRSFRVESRSGPFWRAEARSGKGELLPILLDIAFRRAAPPLPGLWSLNGLATSRPDDPRNFPVTPIEQEDGLLQVMLDGKPLTCVVCGNQDYQQDRFLLNTRSGELLGLAWADDRATYFICARCGYIFWFFIKEVKRSKAGNPPDAPLLDRIFGP
jgi:hypothetical protein